MTICKDETGQIVCPVFGDGDDDDDEEKGSRFSIFKWFDNSDVSISIAYK